MLKGGVYVRLLGDRGYRGTIEGSKCENGSISYLFQPDPKLSQPVRECWVGEGDVEICEGLRQGN
jgi:hypothetical protein